MQPVVPSALPVFPRSSEPSSEPPIVPATTSSATPSANSQEAYLPPTPPAYVPPKKTIPFKTVLALILAFVTILGGGAAYYLLRILLICDNVRQVTCMVLLFHPPATTPPAATVPPPSSSTACSIGNFNCGSYSSDPAGCSSHAGQGCYYHAQSTSCKCDTGGGGDNNPTGATASCGGGKAHVCPQGNSGATFCVSSCSQEEEIILEVRVVSGVTLVVLT